VTELPCVGGPWDGRIVPLSEGATRLLVPVPSGTGQWRVAEYLCVGDRLVSQEPPGELTRTFWVRGSATP
jgi:hypothetical protein